MEVIKTEIDGVVIIEPRIFKDDRGYFYESFSQREFEEKVCHTTFVQDNQSKSSYGVLLKIAPSLHKHEAVKEAVMESFGEISAEPYSRGNVSIYARMIMQAAINRAKAGIEAN